MERFIPPRSTDTPTTLFSAGIGEAAIPRVHRFLRNSNPQEILIYTDGCCLNNGKDFAKAGCAFFFRPSAAEVKGYVSFRLEHTGPSGQSHPQTSNRAELRAVIAALQFRRWDGEGFRRLVIATDSEYVVEGATVRVKKWKTNGWRTATKAPVKNRDLWEFLMEQIAVANHRGVHVSFWRIPREQNVDADAAAKAVANDPDRATFAKIVGVLV